MYAVSFHTLEINKQANTEGEKWLVRPNKGLSLCQKSRPDGSFLFEAKSIIYMNYMPTGETVNAVYIKKGLTRLRVIFKQEKPPSTLFIFPRVKLALSGLSSFLGQLQEELRGGEGRPNPEMSLLLVSSEWSLAKRASASMVTKSKRT